MQVRQVVVDPLWVVPDVVVMREPWKRMLWRRLLAYVQRWWIRLCPLWIWYCVGRSVDVPNRMCGCVKGADFSICGTNGGGAGTSTGTETVLGKHDRRTQ